MVHKCEPSGSEGSVPAGNYKAIGDFIFASHSGLNVTPNMVSTYLLQDESEIHAWVCLSVPY